MVTFHHTSHTYDYSFPAVTLAYFLRYPNPFAPHVLSTDVLARTFDPSTQRLHTVRLHLKRSKLPPALLRLLPKSLVGSGTAPIGAVGAATSGAAEGTGATAENTEGNSRGAAAGPSTQTQAFILEESVVDIREGWMRTESRNLEWTGVLSVREMQMYWRRGGQGGDTAAGGGAGEEVREADGKEKGQGEGEGPKREREREWTDVTTTVTLSSRLGQGLGQGGRQRGLLRGRFGKGTVSSSSSSSAEESESGSADSGGEEEAREEEQPKMGFLKSWGTAKLQRSIERIGLSRAERSQPNAKEGMKVVLERLRLGGLVGVLEGMRRDGEGAFKRND